MSMVLRWMLVATATASVLLWSLFFVWPTLVFTSIDQLVPGLLLVAAACIMALGCAVCRERGRLRGLMASGMLASAAAAVISLYVIWLGAPPQMWKAAGMAGVWAGCCSLIGLLMMHRTSSRAVAWVRNSTILSAALLALVGESAIALEEAMWRNQDLLWRTIGLLMVPTVAGSLTTLLLLRLRSLDDASGDRSDDDVLRVPFMVRCPRCGLHQELLTGGSNCRQCRLHMRIVVP